MKIAKIFAFSLPFFLLIGLVSAQDSYSYYCSGNSSMENKTINGTATLTQMQCQFGCDNSSALNYHANSMPDLCSVDPFIQDLEVSGALIGLIIFVVLMYKWVGKK